MKRLLLIVFVGIVCAAGGYFVGWDRGRADAVAGREQTVTRIGAGEGAGVGADPRAEDRPAPEADGVAQSGSGGGTAGGQETMGKVIALLRTGGIRDQGSMMKAMGLMGQLDEPGVREGLEMASEIRNPQQQMMLRMGLLVRLAEFDGRGAIDYVEESIDGQMREQALMSVATTWAGDDPAAVLAWYQAKKDANEIKGAFSDNQIMAGVFSGFAGQDLDGAFARLGELTDEEQRQQALGGIATSSFSDPAKRDRFVALAKALDDPAEGETAIKQAVGQWAHFDAQAAVAWLDDQDVLDADAVDGSRRDIARSLSWNMPEEAAEMVGEIKSAETRGDATRDIVSSWARRDVNAAAEWLGSQGGGAELDGARGALADAAAEKDPESAFVWASTITEGNQRERVIQRVFTKWHATDPGRAAEFLVASDVERDKVEQWLEEAVGNAGGADPDDPRGN